MNLKPAEPLSSLQTNDESRRKDLREVVVEGLRKRILNWEYPPGHRLTEDQLCHEYGVSRSPVREALHRLEASGIIRRLPRRGYEVNQLDLKDIEDLYELRLALELFVVERLCERGIPDSVLNEQKHLWREVLKTPPQSHHTLAELDRQFHEALAAAIDNAFVLKELRSINDRISFIRVLDFEIAQRTKSTCDQHLQLLEFIVRRDTVGARNAMKINVEDGCNNVEAVIKEALAKAHGLSARRG